MDAELTKPRTTPSLVSWMSRSAPGELSTAAQRLDILFAPAAWR